MKCGTSVEIKRVFVIECVEQRLQDSSLKGVLTAYLSKFTGNSLREKILKSPPIEVLEFQQRLISKKHHQQIATDVGQYIAEYIAIENRTPKESSLANKLSKELQEAITTVLEKNKVTEIELTKSSVLEVAELLRIFEAEIEMEWENKTCPCPFCDRSCELQHYDNTWRLQCRTCSASGPLCTSAEEAFNPEYLIKKRTLFFKGVTYYLD
jgi:hypothetical protein